MVGHSMSVNMHAGIQLFPVNKKNYADKFFFSNVHKLGQHSTWSDEGVGSWPGVSVVGPGSPGASVVSIAPSATRLLVITVVGISVVVMSVVVMSVMVVSVMGAAVVVVGGSYLVAFTFLTPE